MAYTATPAQVAAQAAADDADQDHRVLSEDGWECETCGLPANGQTDADGVPTMAGDSVHHIAPAA